jgi:hypothetical protein
MRQLRDRTIEAALQRDSWWANARVREVPPPPTRNRSGSAEDGCSFAKLFRAFLALGLRCEARLCEEGRRLPGCARSSTSTHAPLASLVIIQNG